MNGRNAGRGANSKVFYEQLRSSHKQANLTISIQPGLIQPPLAQGNFR